MCLQPLTIANNSVYQSNDYSFIRYSVPCGRCLECRSSYQSEWRSRISFEIDSLYKRGGVAIFLTFTYSDKCLPIFSDGDFSTPCFNHEDVKTFLNRLKVRAYRAFGKHSYKYFFTSEYGKNTKRPHYHALFFLQPQTNWLQFAKICREVWTYGYMFPKYDLHRDCFVDNDSNYSEIRIRSLVGGAKYVSKYVTKDLSFYEIPEVNAYLSSDSAFKLKPHLPKHWQSNLLGVTALDSINLMDSSCVESLFRNGLLNPLTLKYEPCPRFLINRLCYKNVFTGRFNSVGKRLYDRHLTMFGCIYFRSVFRSRIENTASKVFETLSQLKNGSLSVDVEVPFDKLKFSLTDLSIKVSMFHHLWSNVSPDVFSHFISEQDGNIDDFYNIDACFRVWLHAKDSLFLKLHPSVFDVPIFVDSPSLSLQMRYVFQECYIWHLVYMYVSTYQRLMRLSDSDKHQKLLDELRYQYIYKFNKTLC